MIGADDEPDEMRDDDADETDGPADGHGRAGRERPAEERHPLRTFHVHTARARRIGAEGLPYSGEFQVNALTQGAQDEVRIAVDTDGGLHAVWTSAVSAGDDASQTSIQTRRFRPPLFADGFESGDTSRWSSAVPRGAALL